MNVSIPNRHKKKPYKIAASCVRPSYMAFLGNSVELLLFVTCCEVSESFHPVAALHTCYADDDERYAEHLSHVERKCLLECFLHFLGVFDEESCREDVGEAESEEESCAHTLRLFAVDSPSDEEE